MDVHFDQTLFKLIDQELGLHLHFTHDFSPEGSPPGLNHGEIITQYPNGSIKTQCFYHEGKLYGPSKTFSEEGTLLSLIWYFEGKKVGKSELYYQNGTLYAEEKWLDNVRHGVQCYWDEKGHIKTKARYYRGKLEGESILYWPDGTLKRKSTFHNQKRVEDCLGSSL